MNLVFAYLNSTPNPEVFKPRDYLFVHEKGLLHVTLCATAPFCRGRQEVRGGMANNLVKNSRNVGV